ncbi:MAG: crossover junction endodeoxyribonuclease RuvC, partial [bacterium]|nr:crossover junction endodeoxyribonuclease RuvC [bacterium]
MRVLGIDPGSQITGLGVIEKNGSGIKHIDNICFRTKKNSPFASRLHEIYIFLKNSMLDFKPDSVAVESVFMGKNAMSALKLGEARGLAFVAAVEAGIPVFEYSTREVKQAVTGYGQADKG